MCDGCGGRQYSKIPITSQFEVSRSIWDEWPSTIKHTGSSGDMYQSNHYTALGSSIHQWISQSIPLLSHLQEGCVRTFLVQTYTLVEKVLCNLAHFYALTTEIFYCQFYNCYSKIYNFCSWFTFHCFLAIELLLAAKATIYKRIYCLSCL